MKAILIQIFATIVTTAFLAADPSPESSLDATKAQLAKINLGMTRTQVEAILGQDWKWLLTAGYAGGQDTRYQNKKLPDYYIELRYDWTGERGIGRRSKPEAPVIRLPELKSSARPAASGAASPAWITIEGAADTPEMIAYSEGMTLTSALDHLFHEVKTATLVRGTSRTTYQIRAMRKDPTKDVALKPGDIIQIPRSFF